MKRIILPLVVSAAVCLLFADDLIGRGGGGRGGGGGGRGGGGGGGSIGGGGRVGGGGSRGRLRRPWRRRSGAAGRALATKCRRARPAGVGNRPSQGQLHDFLDVGRPSQLPAGRPGAGPVGPSQGAVGDFLGGRGPGPGVGAGVGKPGISQLPANRSLAQNRPERVQNRQQLQQTRQDRRQEVRNEFRDNHPRWDWALDHPRWAAWRVNAPWRWATVAALTGWIGWGSPSYYDYGENIYYADDAVYSDGQQIATADQYAAAAEQIATNIPAVKNPDWMPLGVFAITQDGQASGDTPTMFVQLAVSKEGIISGIVPEYEDGHGSAARGHGGQEQPACRLGALRQDAADHGNRAVQPDQGHGPGAAALRRRPDPAMAADPHG